MALPRVQNQFRIKDFNSAAAIEYGKIRALLEMQGTPIDSMDMLIAAHAKTLGAILVTNNVKEFDRVLDLNVENWV
jgi:tRNA(fMet)-specific endonuclease VapC